MAGRPLTMADVERLEEIPAAEIERVVFDRLAEGCTVRRLGEELGVRPAAFYAWKKRDPEREIAWQAALAARASTFAEDGIDILDDLTKVRIWTDSEGKEHRVPMTTEEIRLAEARVNHRKWLASVTDRERYGQQSKVDVNLTVNGLHLTATRTVESLFANSGEDADEADFEVVEDVKQLPSPRRTFDTSFLGGDDEDAGMTEEKVRRAAERMHDETPRRRVRLRTSRGLDLGFL